MLNFLVATLAVLVLLLPNPSHAYFNDPDDACAVLRVRTTTLGQQNYRDLCSPSLFPSLFDPQTQYGTTKAQSPCPILNGVPTQDARWPLCIAPPGGVDLGYRYPRRVNAASSSTTQDLATDWWRVCATADLSTITSNPTAGQSSCALGQEIGRCMPSAHYYERIENAQIKTPAARFYDFILTHPDCTTIGSPSCSNCDDADGCTDVCATEVLSVVNTCKDMCKRYFGRLRFKVGATAAASDWEIVTGANVPELDCGQATPPVADGGEGDTLANQCVDLQGFCNQPVSTSPPATCLMTPLQICLNNCGPPFTDWNGLADTPPFISTLGTKPPYDKHNHWYGVSFGRAWNPNDNLDNWMRSYSVNRDKPNAPSNICGDAVGKYCNAVIPWGSQEGTPKRIKCKDNFLPANWDRPVPPGDANGAEGSPFSFCDHFFFANMLCTETCTAGGTDSAQSTQHFCNDIGGILGHGPCRPEAGLHEAATCCSNNEHTPCAGREECCPTETQVCPAP